MAVLKPEAPMHMLGIGYKTIGKSLAIGQETADGLPLQKLKDASFFDASSCIIRCYVFTLYV